MPYTSFTEFLEAVRASADLRVIFPQFKIPVDASGMCCCPFHPDSHPSMSVSKKLYHCFGCKASGDVFTFFQRVQGILFRESVYAVARHLGLALYYPPAQEVDQIEVEHQMAAMITEVAIRYFREMTPEASRYLTDDRGIPAHFLNKYLLGWSDGTVVPRLVREWGPSWAPIAYAAGLANRRGNDHLFNRVIFPTLAHSGGAEFLSGRTMDPAVEPKYLNLRGRKSPLYNYAAITTAEVFLTEGQIDCLSLCAWDYPAVGLHGSVREVSVLALRRAHKIYLVLDPDHAGVQASLSLAQQIGLADGRVVRIVRLPDGLDPNDFYRRRTKTEFQQLVDASVSPVQFGLSQLPRILDPETATRSLEPLLRLVASYPAINAEYYLDNEIAPYFRWSSRALKAAHRQVDDYRAHHARQCPSCGTVLEKWGRIE